jgi:hypothetical protein
MLEPTDGQATLIGGTPRAEDDPPLVGAAKAVVWARANGDYQALGEAIDRLDQALAGFLTYGHVPY